MKLLSNRPGKINYDSPDYFDYVNKGEAIKHFLENAEDGLNGNNMIVLFGDWGSGKSTLMEYIQRELDGGKKYKTVFFTAWEHEKDDNLPLSLVDAITGELKKGEAVKALIKESAAFFVNMFRGLTIKTPDILGFGFEYDFDKQQEAFNKYYEKIEKEGSFFKKIKDFKESFQKMEDEILEENQKLIVFIDDLDRCEPENILTLLSSIKLFFSLGKRTIFFFGVDKEAVTNAVKTKYDDIIKSDEYLEKVFDISFEMPKNTALIPLLKPYFLDHTPKIQELLRAIDFLTPRHIKKVLNKYEILKSFKDIIRPSDWSDLVPNITKDGQGEFLDVVLTLFIIIVYEYYPEIFIELEDYEGKIIEYARLPKESGKPNVHDFTTALSQITGTNYGFCFNSLKGIQITDIVRHSDEANKELNNPSPQQNYRSFIRFLSLFTPRKTKSLDPNINGIDESQFIKQFDSDENKLLVNFCDFLYKNKAEVLKSKSTYIYSNFFWMARTLL
jgi:hypothetical protein